MASSSDARCVDRTDASSSTDTVSRRRNAAQRGGGVLQDEAEDKVEGNIDDEAENEIEPPPGVVMRLSELSDCDIDSCYAALVASGNDFHGALAQLRQNAPPGGKSRAQMKAALQMLEEARSGGIGVGGVGRGALGGAWVAASLLLGALERIVPRRVLEILLALLGLRADGPAGLIALLLPPLLLVFILLMALRHLDGLFYS
eukprot:gnl/MRDRNA2_/MRDRNA2_84412_c1_seq1.p1 gnl/MRDRNA2_/MRDRNA2_84412_c1~~gnl/MRDRNA2_/MRDRNA2_84412_c1_seq1.p1  ORF type:complete len:202 (-),score=52.48 gnl/MRDRNA2_/MRDRNA2_84412_c1_seq1:54-659(-)